ncbi:MAG: hypothetical protein IT334_04455, partial [Thermomicrobiales bacterium]|nr:hypothetical protein [Thermomicrobiales bacterium]
MNRLQKFCLFLTIVLVLSLVPTGSAGWTQRADAADPPRLRLNGVDSTTEQVGEVIPWDITGFPNHSWVVLQYVVPGGEPIWIQNAQTDSNGRASGTITIPHRPGGVYHTIEARSGSVRDTARFQTNEGSFAVLASNTSPTFPVGGWQTIQTPSYLTVESGQSVRFYFSGLTAGETYSLEVWEVNTPVTGTLATVVADANGDATRVVSITVPGIYNLVGNSNWYVTNPAVISIPNDEPDEDQIANADRSEAYVGDVLTINAANFVPSAPLEIQFDSGPWQTIGSTNGSGSATFSFTVPATKSGFKIISIRTDVRDGPCCDNWHFAFGTVYFNVQARVTASYYFGDYPEITVNMTGIYNDEVAVAYYHEGAWVGAGTAAVSGNGGGSTTFFVPTDVGGTVPIRVGAPGWVPYYTALEIDEVPELSPVALIAIGDRTLVAGANGKAATTLDGSDSFDYDGSIVTWEWARDNGSAYQNFATTPSVDLELEVGVHDFRLTVIDNDDREAEKFVRITVIADAAASFTLDRGTVGTNVLYEIIGFPVSSPVTISLVRSGSAPKQVVSTVTDYAGAALGGFAIPAMPGGNYQLRVASGSTTVERPFEVAPRITPTPSWATPGQTVSVNLRGFAANDNLTIRWKVGTSFVTVGTARTSATGSLTNKTIVVPLNAAAGPNTIRVQGTINQQSNAVTVIVPTASVSPVRTTVNSKVTYALSSFPANSHVTITWVRLSGGTINMGTVITDANGAASGQLTVPATPGGAGQQIVFTSGAISTTALFEVAPRVKVTPGSVAQGATMDISLRGFAKGEPVTIRWRAGSSGAWTTIASGTTSNTGSANIAFTVPNNAVTGAYQVRAESPSFNQQTSALTVTGGDPFGGAADPEEEASPTATPEPTATVTPEPTPDATPEPTETGTPEETPTP